MFKVYYLDPLMVNTNLLFNCFEENDSYKFDLFYNTTFEAIENCIDNGKGCEFVCKEFKFGTTGEMFIGKLDTYLEFLDKVQELLTKYHPEEENTLNLDDPNSEFYIDRTVEDNPNFFRDTEQPVSNEDYILRNYDMAHFELLVQPKGINLFHIANNSKYMLTNALTDRISLKHHGINEPGKDSAKKGGTRLDEFSFENQTTSAFNLEQI